MEFMGLDFFLSQILVVYKHTYITTECNFKETHTDHWISTPYDCFYSTSTRIFCRIKTRECILGMLFSVFLLYLYYENNVYIFTFSDVHIHIHGGIVKDSTAIARIFCLIKEDKTLHLLKITNSFLFNFQ